MQRWGGILFYTFLSESSLPRLLNFRMLPLFQTDSGTGGTDDQTIFLRTICWLVHWLYYSSSNSVEFLDFAEKCVLQHLFVIAVQRAWVWDYVDFWTHKLRSEVCVGRVYIAAAKSLPRVWKLHIGLRACYGKKNSCNALELGYMKYLTSDWFC